ncbi:hypothetical protein BGW39_001701 [Mortierella sp. 14UC]|nr:hypothetical protein BGW39_001701 [Mortierella sp. 14UC]
MSPTQQFRLGNDIQSLDLRRDADGTHYSEMDDIQDIFPGASRFKINGSTLSFSKTSMGRVLVHGAVE